MKNLLFYSVNSYLSFKINEKYYHDIHYIWAAPYFNTTGNPISSNPKHIYKDIYNSIFSNDNHSTYIARNRTNLMAGAQYKFDENVITSDEKDEIISIVSSADIHDFKPLIYVIPARNVTSMIIHPKISEKANPFSEEYRIEKLPREYFDIVEVDL